MCTVIPKPFLSSTSVGDDGRVAVQVGFPLAIPPDYRARVEYAVGSDPAEGDWRTAGYADEAGTVYTAPIPIGSPVRVRLVGEAPGYRPTDATTAAEDQAPETPALRTLEPILDEDGNVIVYWTPNEFCNRVFLEWEVVVRGATPTYPSSADLDAADEEFAVPDPVPEGYDLAVRATAFDGYTEGKQYESLVPHYETTSPSIDDIFPQYEQFEDPLDTEGLGVLETGQYWRQHADGAYDDTTGLFFRNEANDGWVPLINWALLPDSPGTWDIGGDATFDVGAGTLTLSGKLYATGHVGIGVAPGAVFALEVVGAGNTVVVRSNAAATKSTVNVTDYTGTNSVTLGLAGVAGELFTNAVAGDAVVRANKSLRLGISSMGVASLIINEADGSVVLNFSISPRVNDGVSLGTLTGPLQFSDAYFATGAVIGFNSATDTLTHSAGTLTWNGALVVTGADASNRAVLATQTITSLNRFQADLANQTPAAGLVPGGASFLGTNTSSVQVTGVGASATVVVPGLYLRAVRARGTIASPTTIVSGDRMLTIAADGWTGSARVGDMATIFFEAEGTIGATRIPTRIVFSTATDATTSVLTEALRIDSAQRVRFSGAAVPHVDDGVALGSSALRWSDADFASGAVIRFANSYTMTHASGKLDFSGRVGVAGSNAGTAWLHITNNLTMTGAEIQSFRISGYLKPDAGSNAQHYSVDGTFDTANGLIASVTGIITQTYVVGAGGVTNAYGIRILTDTLSSAAVTNSYGLKIENHSHGGTLNYAIHTSAGKVFFTGVVVMGADFTANFEGVTSQLTVVSRAAGVTYYANDASGPLFILAKSRSGTNGTLVYPTSGDVLGVLGFAGADQNDSRFERGAEVRGVASETWTATAQGSYLAFWTTLPTTLTYAERWRITDAGVLQSLGAQTIQTSTGQLTIKTLAGNGDILLSPHGTGLVAFGAHTNIGAETVTGFLTAKDAAGNTRKLAVVS